MSKDWTIDTWVLYKVVEYNFCAASFIETIINKQHYIVMDSEGKIDAEYRKCFSSVSNEARRALSKWYRSMRKRIYSHCLDEDCKRKLEEFEFDQDDWPFVGVCVKSNDKNLVAEESDYTDEVKNYLINDLGINVLSVQHALDNCQEI